MERYTKDSTVALKFAYFCMKNLFRNLDLDRILENKTRYILDQI